MPRASILDVLTCLKMSPETSILDVLTCLKMSPETITLDRSTHMSKVEPRD